MRTPRLFLEIFALALLLPLLLLACGGSDDPADGPSSERATAEPTDMPDSTRATAEPEGRASSGETTAEPTTENDEPPPTPTATARPPMAQTSPETDREALIALYNATGGPDWRINRNWLTDVPVGEWEGVTTDDNGHVTVLDLSYNQLSGEIPPKLGNLENLIELYLFLNQLSGEIPPELGNLENLIELHLNENQLSGEIPPELGNFENLTVLSLSANQLSGEIPPELGNLENLRELYLSKNQLSECVPSSLSGRLDPYQSNLGDLQFCP